MKKFLLCYLFATLFSVAVLSLLNACSKEEGPGGGSGGTTEPKCELKISVEPRADGVIVTCDMGRKFDNMRKTLIVGGNDLKENVVIDRCEDIDETHYKVDSRNGFIKDQSGEKPLRLMKNSQYWCQAHVYNGTEEYVSEKATFNTDKSTVISLEVVDVTAYTITVRATSNTMAERRSILYYHEPNVREMYKRNPHLVNVKEEEEMGDTFETTFTKLDLNKTYYFIADFFTGKADAYSEEIEVVTNDRHQLTFPDANFQKRVVERYGSDGVITQGQALAVTDLDLSNAGISDLSGMGWFANIRRLDLSGNLMETMDTVKMNSGSSGIKKINVFKCDDCPNLRNAVISIDFSADSLIMNRNPNLKKVELLVQYNGRCSLKYASLADNGLEELIMTNEGDDHYLGFTELHCENNRLTELNIRGAYLYCQNNNISSLNFVGDKLDVSNNKLTYLSLKDRNWKDMTMLHCQNNPDLTEVIVKDEYFATHIEDLLMDPQTKFVWPQE